MFQTEFQTRTLRMTICDPQVWSIAKAQERARELQRQIDDDRDPREVKAEATAADVAKRRTESADALTVADVWPRYMAEGKPKRRSAWKPRYVADLNKAASMGGEPKKRGKGMRRPGHLAGLMPLPLASIDQDVIREWYAYQAKSAPIRAARAVAMFSGFLGWCATKKELRELENGSSPRTWGTPPH